MSTHIARRANGHPLFTQETGVMIGHREYGPATLRLCIPGALPHALQQITREVLDVFVPVADRRHGVASELLWHVCQEADVHAMALMLTVRPYGQDDAPDSGVLERWYANFGFATVQTEPITIMVRRVRAVMH